MIQRYSSDCTGIYMLKTEGITMKNPTRNTMLKRIIAFACAFTIMISCLPASAGTTAPTKNPDLSYGDLIAMGLADITAYGVVAETYHQNGHAETSTAVSTLDKNTGDPFMPTKDTMNDQGDLVITAKVTVNGAHSAFTTKFALFTKSGTTYTRVTDPVTASFTAKSGSETLDLEPFTITDQATKVAGVYLMEVDQSGNYVLNGATGDQSYTVQYGDDAAVDPLPIKSTQLVNYIGKIDIDEQNVRNSNNIKLMQGDSFSGQRVDFGPNIHLYEKIGNSYYVVDNTTTHAVSQLYLRDDTWTVTGEYAYKKFENVTYDGAGTFTYGGYEIQFGFDVTDPVPTLLSNAVDISEALAGPAVTSVTGGLPGGTLAHSRTTVSQTDENEYWGNSTVASWEEMGGNFEYTALSFYTVDGTSGRFNVADIIGEQWQPLPISDNEYIVINVICPSSGTVATSE